MRLVKNDNYLNHICEVNEVMYGIYKVSLILHSISIPTMTGMTKGAEANGVDCNLEEEAKYLKSEYNNTMSGNYTLVGDYGSTSDVDKE